MIENVAKWAVILFEPWRVEITIAMHRAFNSPKDSIIFRRRAQSIAIDLTGRLKAFCTLRQGKGSPASEHEESEHDPFNTGHTSTANLAALALRSPSGCSARKVRPIALVATVPHRRARF
jgi:1-deoxy-D-xylulose-5-phosphate synthase